MASTTSASATGWPWKLPPETISPVSAKTRGLSVAAFTSRASTARQNPSPSRAAPWTWGMQRSE